MKEQTDRSDYKERISDFIIRKQKIWAIWIGGHANRGSRRAKEVMLAIFILVSANRSLFLIIRHPPPVLEADNITTPVSMEKDKTTLSRIQQYRTYRDSLSIAKKRIKYESGKGTHHRCQIISGIEK